MIAAKRSGRDFGSAAASWEWQDMKKDDEGVTLSVAIAHDVIVQVTGVFSGASVAIEGACDANMARVPIADINYATIAALPFVPFVIAPRIIGGDENTCLDVAVLIREGR